MNEDDDGRSKISGELQLVTDGESLLVVGAKRRDVEKFLKAHGLMERAHKFSEKHLVSTLRTSGNLAQSISETVKASGMWVKLTEESAEAVKEFGLMDSGKSGVAHAMIGRRGDIKKWLSIDVSTTARLSNPAALSGVATAMTQASREQEAKQLRILLEKIDQKLDKVLRGQNDEIFGDLIGLENTIKAAMTVRDLEGMVDQLDWSKLTSAPLLVRRVQAKALLKLGGLTADLEQKQNFKELRQDLEETKSEVQMWLSALTRCTIALDELTVLELDYFAQLEPEKVDSRRIALNTARQEDQAALLTAVSALIERMDEAADEVDDHKLLHAIAVPKALKSLEAAKQTVTMFTDAIGMDVDWDKFDATQWVEALREWEQWKNAGGEVGKVAWEKGAPVVGSILLAVATAVVTKKFPGKPEA